MTNPPISPSPSISAYTSPESTLNQLKAESAIDEYISARIFKQKSPLCRIAIPYIFEEAAQPEKKKTIKEMVKKNKRSIPKYPPMKSHKPFKPFFNYQKTPINEYLNYELSEQINFGLKEVKVLADEIKQIKDEKKKQVLKSEDKKQNKKIRIRRTIKDKHLLHSSASCLR